ncbi:hypothetical protein ACI2K4_29445 [Micromonospora sp. NPDC050397]|uniref:hypothetical protein n=1 Tax=Micromonospora sp. NPDC050397 TaxID=3364279 RepID=UPI00384F3967
MLVNTYDPQSSRRLAASIAVGAAGRAVPTAQSGSTQVVDVGGGWHPNNWREDVRRLANRGRVTALALRTEPSERYLSNYDWSRITRGMVDHLGLADRPWVAVRTSPNTLTLLTDAANGPLQTDSARAFVRTAAGPRPTVGEAQLAGEPGATAPGADTAQNAKAPAPPRSLAQLSFAAPPTATSGATAATPALQPSAVPMHQTASRPHAR